VWFYIGSLAKPECFDQISLPKQFLCWLIAKTKPIPVFEFWAVFGPVFLYIIFRKDGLYVGFYRNLIIFWKNLAQTERVQYKK
tara:strand:- start:281 stop:529 length:249 start_codon:yes stop_codon:yes gene_type:complete